VFFCTDFVCLFLIHFLAFFFVVDTLNEKQKRLQEVESIKEDASANYVSYRQYYCCLKYEMMTTIAVNDINLSS